VNGRVGLYSELMKWFSLGRRVASGRRKKLESRIRSLPARERFKLARRLLTEKKLPLPARLAIPSLVAYLASPVDLIPDFVPVIGQIDDALALAVAALFLVRPSRIEIIESHITSIEESLIVGTPDGGNRVDRWSLTALVTTLAKSPAGRRLLKRAAGDRTKKVWSSGVKVFKAKFAR
jgi:uncharacterized membrane protein YkvA (DUF1232 family)